MTDAHAPFTAATPNRRSFIKLGIFSGIAVYMGQAKGLWAQENTISGAAYHNSGNAPITRIDGIAKVTGEKIFAYDLRSADLKGWPKRQAYATILRVPFADRPYLGLDLSILPENARPDKILTAADLKADGVDFPEFYTKEMLLPEGKVAPILGQAVAILIFKNYSQFHNAKKALQFRNDIFRFGDPIELRPLKPWNSLKAVYVSSDKKSDTFSVLNDGMIKPVDYKNEALVWPTSDRRGNKAARGMWHAQNIDDALASPSSTTLILRREYTTSSNDAVALEPENANCWYDKENESIHLLVAVQNPHDILVRTAELIKKSRFRIKSIYVQPCHTVSYGAKDSSNHPFYTLVASLYSDGLPVRIALDRYENFQAGLKRHPFKMDYTIAVHQESGKFEILRNSIIANGGGRPSFSPIVIQESTMQSTGIYSFPRSYLTGIAERTVALDASAVRGFGNLQTMSGLEMLVDELAGVLGRDPIDLRIQNAIVTGTPNSQGGIQSGQVRIREVLQTAQRHPLWLQRQDEKKRIDSQNLDHLYGVGFACAQKNFGMGAEAAFAKVEVTLDGKINVFHCGIEMGTGFTTTQAQVCREAFGRQADYVQSGFTDWRDIPIHPTGSPFTNTQAFEDQEKQKSTWSPYYVSATAATNTAYYFTHVTRQAAAIIAEFGLWPAALSLWGYSPEHGSASTEMPRFQQARWTKDGLTARGMEPLHWSRLVKRMYDIRSVTGAAVHSFNRWQWAEADYTIGGSTIRLPLDGVSVRYGAGHSFRASHYTNIIRKNIFYPPVKRYRGGPTLTSTAATIVAVSVNRKDGSVSVLNHHTIVECGRLMVPQLALGQVRGATAMGIGYALFEELPLYNDGPGAGDWNLDRYRLPRMDDVALWSQTVEFLPPLSETDPPKGFAEAVIIPIAPAIGNAIAHACGKRLYHFPMTPERVKEILP